jgi:hypothetical protein
VGLYEVNLRCKNGGSKRNVRRYNIYNLRAGSKICNLFFWWRGICVGLYEFYNLRWGNVCNGAAKQ